MKKLVSTLAVIFACYYCHIYGQIINVPADVPTIQNGIEAANEGDTVLVAEGTYFENIDYRGKAITVASLFLIDGDTSHISKTIIDGSNPTNPDSASVVYMAETLDTTSVLCGLTIQGGTGTLIDYRGADCFAGGGILLNNGKIVNNKIINNNLITTLPNTWVAGGAICKLRLNLAEENSGSTIVRENIISDNIVNATLYPLAAGITIEATGSQNIIENNTICNNTGTLSGNPYKAMAGGLSIHKISSDTGTVVVRNNRIYSNKLFGTVTVGAGIYIVNENNNEVSVYKPTEIYNNLIYDNYSEGLGGGIGIWYTGKENYSRYDPLISNNTIINNKAALGAGISNIESKVVLLNNILYNDLSIEDSEEIFKEVYTYCPGWCVSKDIAEITAKNNNIQGGWEDVDNIDADPQFVSGTFELSESSPCIGNGAESIEVEGFLRTAPIQDINNSIRPNPVDQFIDIGAYESHYAKPGQSISQSTFIQSKVYPNPSKESVTVEADALIQQVELIDITGKVLKTYDNINSNKTVIERCNLGSGIYFMRITFGENIAINKLVLL